MLDYSGNLLWGLAQMGQTDVARGAAAHDRARRWRRRSSGSAPCGRTPSCRRRRSRISSCTCWPGVITSRALFGLPALARVRGFSPPEMHLPIHPDVCFAYVSALRGCGYRWLMVQEHTVENTGRDAAPPAAPAAPAGGPQLRGRDGVDPGADQDPGLGHQARRSDAAVRRGEVARPAAVRRPRGPALRAADRRRRERRRDDERVPERLRARLRRARRRRPSDVVAHERHASTSRRWRRWASTSARFPTVQPVSQHRIWEQMTGPGPGAADRAIARLRERDPSFNLDRASWTSDRSWVEGYGDVHGSRAALSAAVSRALGSGRRARRRPRDPAYRTSLLYLLLSQTSCFRYWGHGFWTDIAQEICRRGLETTSS